MTNISVNEPVPNAVHVSDLNEETRSNTDPSHPTPEPSELHSLERHPFDPYPDNPNPSEPHPFDPIPSDPNPSAPHPSTSNPAPPVADSDPDLFPDLRSRSTSPPDPRSLSVPTTVSDFVSFEHTSNFSADGIFGVSIIKELVGVEISTKASIRVEAKFGRLDERHVGVDDLHDALKGRRVNFNHDLVRSQHE